MAAKGIQAAFSEAGAKTFALARTNAASPAERVERSRAVPHDTPAAAVTLGQVP
jgi:hypothetical protein